MSSSRNCPQCGRISGSKTLVVCIYTESLVDQFCPSFFHKLFGGEQPDQGPCCNIKQSVYSAMDTGKELVRQVYGKLCELYGGTDDRIYLFGIDRGADKVLELVQWIEMFGLICPGQEHLLDAAKVIWKDKSSERAKRAERFKSIHSKQGVRIHFVGTWDSDRQRPEGFRLEDELEKYPVDSYRRVVSIDEHIPPPHGIEHRSDEKGRRTDDPPKACPSEEGLPPYSEGSYRRTASVDERAVDGVSAPRRIEHQTEKQGRQTDTPKPAPFKAIHFQEPIPGGRDRDCPASFRWLALHAKAAGLRVRLSPPAVPQRFRPGLPPREAAAPPPGRKRFADLLPGRSAGNDRSTGSAERPSTPVWCRVDDEYPGTPNDVAMGPSYTVEDIVFSM